MTSLFCLDSVLVVLEVDLMVVTFESSSEDIQVEVGVEMVTDTKEQETDSLLILEGLIGVICLVEVVMHIPPINKQIKKCVPIHEVHSFISNSASHEIFLLYLIVCKIHSLILKFIFFRSYLYSINHMSWWYLWNSNCVQLIVLVLVKLL